MLGFQLGHFQGQFHQSPDLPVIVTSQQQFPPLQVSDVG